MAARSRTPREISPRSDSAGAPAPAPPAIHPRRSSARSGGTAPAGGSSRPYRNPHRALPRPCPGGRPARGPRAHAASGNTTSRPPRRRVCDIRRVAWNGTGFTPTLRGPEPPARRQRRSPTFARAPRKVTQWVTSRGAPGLAARPAWGAGDAQRLCQLRGEGMSFAESLMASARTHFSGNPAGRRWTSFSGLFFDEFATDSAWIRETGRVRLPPLPGVTQLRLRGELKPHPAAQGIEAVPP